MIEYITSDKKTVCFPDEYSVINFRKFDSKIRRNIVNIKSSGPFRFYKYFIYFLSKIYKGNLPNNIGALARKFGYAEHLVALFELDEEEYKSVYPNEFKDFFENKSEEERDLLFYSADCGWRSIFQLEQDTVASNLLEDMIAFHSLGMIHSNEDASGRGSSKISTKCDLVYEGFFGMEQVKIPLELKTKWSKSFDGKVSFRGNANKIFEDKGMVLVVYAGLKVNNYYSMPPKGALIDTCAEMVFKHGMYVAKECEYTEISADSLFNFEFWNENVMRDFLNLIHTYYYNRKNNPIIDAETGNRIHLTNIDKS